MIQYYILDGHEVKPAKDVIEWGKFFEGPGRHVAKTTMPDGTWISTVFLGIDHRHFGKGPPLVFETMVFPNGGKPMIESYCDRYSTWDEAEAGHNAVVAKLERGESLYE